MTHPVALIPDLAEPADRKDRQLRRRRSWWWLTSWPASRGVVMAIALTGAGVLLFPITADWFHTRSHSATGQAYAQTVHSLPRAKVRDELEAAKQYNQHLPAGTTPAAIPTGAESDPIATGTDSAAYREILNIGPDGMMGTLAVPKIGVNLPIYHGTEEAALSRGAGHLFGTAVPVGGPGTHTVLTGHSGIPGDTLFTRLRELKIGDTFTITVLDQVLTYRVDQIVTVLPNQVQALSRVPGKDYATLITCTPIGVNSHRLLVRGVRVPTSRDTDARDKLGTRSPDAGPPWWALIAAGALVLCIIGTIPMAERSSEP